MATVILAMLLFIVALCSTSGASAQTAGLQKNFYEATCPGVEGIVSMAVYAAVLAEPRMGASLLRLHFHDCFVQGCDGSILLDDTATFKGEKTAGPNNNSVRGFEVIDNIKSAVELVCPGVVSCADIVTLAARDSVVALRGPTWPVALGRRDSTTASFSLANADLPGAGFNLSQLISKFQKQGLSAKDMIVLSGGHTIGQAQCKNFRAHIYNDTNVDPLLAQQRRQACPFSGGGDSNLAPLDLQTPNSFNNDYFKNLVCYRGLLHSDQELFNGGSADSLVSNYSVNQAAFFADFSASMINMGNINPLTGTQGQIRCNCRRVNSGQ